MPQNSHCTFSPTALKHYLNYPSVTTTHLKALYITTPCNQLLEFPSLSPQVSLKALDYHAFTVVRPTTRLSYLPRPLAHKATVLPLTRALIHQRLGHGSHHKIDLMCRHQTLLGLPKRRLPLDLPVCPICVKAKFTHPPKGKTLDTTHLTKGEYLHMDFAFWDLPSLRHFTGMLVIIDAKTRMLWLFCTSSKCPPLHIISYLLAILSGEQCTVKTVRVDEDGSLARNTDFTSLLLHHRITMDTTGGYSSFLNGKVECPH